MDVSEPLPAAAPKAAAFPPYTLPGIDAVHRKATGFFHAEQQDGRWWLIDPKGRGFLVAGIDHVSYNAGWCQRLGYSPYHRHVEAEFGSEAAWARKEADRLHAWGFNTLAAGCSDDLRYTHFAHTAWLGAGRSSAGVDALVPQTTWTGFPNVFSPRWERECDVLARSVCTPERDDPWLLGYFLDNELQWFGPLTNWQNDAGLFTETWRKPADDPAKRAWMDVVRDNCPTVADFNAAWGTKFASFDALAASTEPVEPPTDAARATARAYVRLVADVYFKTATEAIRRCDPNHMILGCRFAGWAPDIWDIAGKYRDVVSLNSYPRIDVDRGVPQTLVADYRAHYERAGRPLLITEWSFPAMDSGLPNLHGAGMRVATQDQRAACFRAFQSTLFGLPFFVGSDYFMWADEPALGISDSFPEDSNYGLVNVDDRPYGALTGAATAVNAQAAELHLSGTLEHTYAGAAGPAWTVPPPPPPEYRVTAQALTAHCGPLTVDFDSAKGPALLLKYSGEELGRFIPLLQQKRSADAWTPPDSASVDSAQMGHKDFSVVDVTYRHAPGADRAPAYAAGWRFWFPHNHSGWFAVQSLWVENTDTRPWTLAGIFQVHAPVHRRQPGRRRGRRRERAELLPARRRLGGREGRPRPRRARLRQRAGDHLLEGPGRLPLRLPSGAGRAAQARRALHCRTPRGPRLRLPRRRHGSPAARCRPGPRRGHRPSTDPPTQ